MYAKVSSIGLFGLNAFPVEAEVDISSGMPAFDIVGLPDAAVRESRERVKAALRSCGINLPLGRITVNLAPADMKKTGSATDLAIAAALLKVMGVIPADSSDCAFIGEVSLNGEIRPVNGVLPMTLTARQEGVKRLFVPSENAYEASVAEGITVFGVKALGELIKHFGGEEIEPQKPYAPKDEGSFFFRTLPMSRVSRTLKKLLKLPRREGITLF